VDELAIHPTQWDQGSGFWDGKSYHNSARAASRKTWSRGTATSGGRLKPQAQAQAP